MTRNKFMKQNYKFVDYEVMVRLVGKRLAEEKIEKGMTINMLSITSGVNRNTIRRIENGEGKSGIMLKNIMKLACALDLPLQELFAECDYFCNFGKCFNGQDETAFEIKKERI